MVATTGLERREVQHPRDAIELEPQPIGQEHQWATRYLLRTRPSDIAAQCLAEAIPVSGQCYARALCIELANGESVYQHSLQNQCRSSMGSTTALPWPNSPCAVALHALPSPWTKMPNRSATTRGFRM